MDQNSDWPKVLCADWPKMQLIISHLVSMNVIRNDIRKVDQFSKVGSHTQETGRASYRKFNLGAFEVCLAVVQDWFINQCFALSKVSKGFFMTRPTLKTKASVFSMGQRSEVLISELEAPILVPHALEKSGTKVTASAGSSLSNEEPSVPGGITGPGNKARPFQT